MEQTRALAGVREIGHLMREHREAAGVSMREMARRLGKSTTHVHRMEFGDTSEIRVTELIHFLAVCGVDAAEVDRLTDFCQEVNSDRGYWLSQDDEDVSRSLRSLIFHQAAANQLVAYEPEWIPGLLQTERYIDAFLSKDLPEPVRRERLEARLERQDIFNNQQAKFTFVIRERALRLEVGEPKTMSEQMLALLFRADECNIGIRVALEGTIGSGLFGGGAFNYLGYRAFRPLVWLEAPIGGFYVEDSSYVSAIRQRVDEVDAYCLDEADSRKFIADLVDEYDRLQTTHRNGWKLL